MRRLLAAIFVAVVAICLAKAQTPIVVQAASANAPVQRAVSVQAGAGTTSVLRELQAMRAANQEALRKQEATLQLLDELQKQADQLRIYTSRS